MKNNIKTQSTVYPDGYGDLNQHFKHIANECRALSGCPKRNVWSTNVVKPGGLCGSEVVGRMLRLVGGSE